MAGSEDIELFLSTPMQSTIIYSRPVTTDRHVHG